MKWIKHDTNANTDAKLKKLKHKYGLAGYGLYWYCIELIAGNISIDNLTFELEEDAELIAAEWGYDQIKVQEMMNYMVDLELFDISKSSRIRCLKIAQRIDKSMTSNPQMRQLIEQIKSDVLGINHDKSCEPMTESCEPMPDEIRLDENRQKNKAQAPAFSFKKELLERGVDKNVLDDWLKVRKNKKLSNTETALKGFLNSVKKSGLDLNKVVELCATKSWGGFNPDWVTNLIPQDKPKEQTKEDVEARERLNLTIEIKSLASEGFCDLVAFEGKSTKELKSIRDQGVINKLESMRG
jgi:hypothetical protein